VKQRFAILADIAGKVIGLALIRFLPPDELTFPLRFELGGHVYIIAHPGSGGPLSIPTYRIAFKSTVAA
jgi:hypothetical protein